jgi:peptidyl-prolyl cis-trans isomerase SurA
MPAPILPRKRRALALAPHLLTGLAMMAGVAVCQPLGHQAAAQTAKPIAHNPGDETIVAIVNGDVISRADVDNRRRLFALSTGLPITPEVLDRLSSQVTRELIDERLRVQESQRRHVIVQDKEIAEAIADVETRNNMPHGQLTKQLTAAGVEMRTVIDEFRAQIAWGRLLRQEVAEKGPPSDTDVADQEAQFKAQVGQPEFHLSEIFTPVSNPSQDSEALHFTDTVIQQLRAGAPFPVVAAQFSQSQTALQGGDLGWVQPNQLDPAVLRVVNEMPIGAVSNPIKVAGGYTIVTLRAKREIGHDLLTMVKLRQTWLPFTQPLNPQAPTQQQIAQLQVAQHLGQTAHDCSDMEAANAKAGNVRPTDPGELALEQLGNPQMRQLLANLPVGHASEPLPAQDGIVVIMVCSRETRNVGVPSREDLMNKIMADRTELASHQLMRDLQRRAQINMHG